jgi:hypothetical protein
MWKKQFVARSKGEGEWRGGAGVHEEHLGTEGELDLSPSPLPSSCLEVSPYRD